MQIADGDFQEVWEKSGKTLSFESENLYGRINGGAELFLEFGFEKLIIETYSNGNNEIEIEQYVMASPESALGIYLLKCGQKQPSELITARHTVSNYQITALKGNSFVQINSFSGDTNYVPDMISLANAYLAKITEKTPDDIFAKLPQENLIPGSEKLIRGEFGLRPIYTLGPGDMLMLHNKTFAIVASYHDSLDSIYTCIYVLYQSKKQADQVFKHISKNLDSYIEVLEKSEQQIIFKDYRNQFGVIFLQDNVIDIKVNLSIKPVMK